MRWSFVAVASVLMACGTPEVQSQHLKDGSWSFQCELTMEECVRRVQDNCPNQRYRILEGTSETRLRDAPPFERAYHTSRLHLVCNDGGADVLLSVSSKDAVPSPTAAKPSAKLCSAGQTRECIGPGACKGGQACLADGSGFGGCDCGPSPAPATPTPGDAPAEAVSSPVGAPVNPAPAAGSSAPLAPTAPASSGK